MITLNLRSNSIGDEGALHLADALRINMVSAILRDCLCSSSNPFIVGIENVRSFA